MCLQNWRKYCTSRPYLSFPYTTHMTCQRRVHLPLYPISLLFQQELSDFVVVHFFDALCKFVFGFHKLFTIITPNRSYISFSSNELSQWMNESVSKFFVISTWIAQLAKHVKSVPYCFKVVLLSLISNRPIISTPQ